MDGACSKRENMRSAYKICSENLIGRDHLEDLGIHGKMILK